MTSFWSPATRQRLASLARRIANDTGRKVETVKADLTSAADLRRVEDILRTNAGISVLVNNAGVGAADRWSPPTSTRWRT